MCGIVGIIHKNKFNYLPIIETMNKTLNHRGPDASGIESINNTIFGHTRLSIVDIQNGNQPMLSNDIQNLITFNGEIYGFQDTKKELNYEFKTNSDTEVILALYEQYKYNLFEKLNGMFAFGLYDSSDDSLLLARDTFGEKPLYYAIGENGEFIFASEIKAILASNLIKPKISTSALKDYLSYLYIKPDKTIYENIYTLQPSHYLVYKDSKVNIHSYYKYPKTEKIDLDEAKELFQSKFENAVEKQLIADVEVGAFLSGGLDSSTVVSVAKKFKKDLKTYSFGFEGSKSELGFAQEIASKYNTDHYELFAKDYDIASLLLEMPNIYDEPFADSSNIPTFLISKLASKHLKVILTGDGADELLGGYSWWYNPLLGVKKNGNIYQEIFYKILGKSLNRKYSFLAQQNKYARNYNTVLEAHQDRSKYFSDNEISNLLINKFSITNEEYFFDEENNLNDALKYDIQNYMAGDILVKIDRASMANSLELRAPFLDKNFADFCISLPSNLKITNENDKIILRKVFADNWTDTIKKRSKQGFGSPVNLWLTFNSVKQLKNEYLQIDKKIFDFIDFKTAKDYFNKDDYQTWALLNLSIWFERYKEYI